ncbi:uncharacterized protein FMAN_08573 [Fusarium mangiferae]|uniref:Uncharacterized protein n=1 Tax=Fusarium mangiferae TaxID=192010 RepID=A0A1L7TTD6_FUSMA|nr:uncharacterized protein FMAN_08573 [Fusarium mangiferae]CVK98587.1 uncharacterized protein FMAN_08573 [Fusarium mangiferae]
MPIAGGPKKPDPGEPYLTEDRDVIPMIRQALARADQGDRDRLRDLAAEIGSRWGIEDDGDRLALFGCEILRLVRPYLNNPQISISFLDDEIQSLRTLKWALNRGQLWRRQKMFLEALRLLDKVRYQGAVDGGAARVEEDGRCVTIEEDQARPVMVLDHESATAEDSKVSGNSEER